MKFKTRFSFWVTDNNMIGNVDDNVVADSYVYIYTFALAPLFLKISDLLVSRVEMKSREIRFSMYIYYKDI
jgi:hypothetical protein